MQEPAVLENLVKLSNCTHRYTTALGLSCVHDIKYRLDHNERLKLVDFHGYWRYDQWAYKDDEPEIFDLVQNPRVVKSKNRLKEALGSAYASKSKLD